MPPGNSVTFVNPAAVGFFTASVDAGHLPLARCTTVGRAFDLLVHHLFQTRHGYPPHSWENNALLGDPDTDSKCRTDTTAS